jgi:DNA-directed RNA polymerase specialized sigma24 family protein
MATPKSGLQWWDRECDEQGNPIRADVRAAAYDIWHTLCARVRATLGATAEAPELMETAVLYISRHLDRAMVAPPADKAKRLLGLYFSQLLHKRVCRLGRITCVGTTADLDNLAPVQDWDWVTRVNLRLDFEKMLPHVSSRNFTMFTMRRLGHQWDEVGEKLGIETDTARVAFWQAMRKARNLTDGNGYSKRNGGASKR